MYGQLHLFGTKTQLEKLSKLGDPLTKANQIIDWEIFHKPIKDTIRKDPSKGERPLYDVILMYKTVMLQQWYGLSDMQVKYQINDLLSFMRFLGLEIGDKVPDGNTLWDFKEALKTNQVDRKLFDTFNMLLEEKGAIVTHKGSIVDATFVTVPKRHTTKNDDEHLKKDTPCKRPKTRRHSQKNAYIGASYKKPWI